MPPPPRRGPRIRPEQRIWAGDTPTVEVLVWGVSHLSLAEVWRRMRAIVPAGDEWGLKELQLVLPSDPRQRVHYRILVLHERVEEILSRLDGVRAGALMTRIGKVSTLGALRMAAQEAAPGGGRRSRRGLGLGEKRTVQFASLNVNSVGQKKDLLRLWMTGEEVFAVALQETRRFEEDWRLHLFGYKCVERVATGPGKGGLAVVVHSSMSVVTAGGSSPYCLSAVVAGGPLHYRIVVVSIYVPCEGRDGREEAKRDIVEEVLRCRVKYPGRPVMVMGDFNMTEREVERWVDDTSLHGVVRLVKARGQKGSHHDSHGKPTRDIDHVLVTGEMGTDTEEGARVDKSWCEGDHWPVCVDVARVVECGEGNMLRVEEDPDAELAPRFLHHSQWVPRHASFKQRMEEWVELSRAVCNHNLNHLRGTYRLDKETGGVLPIRNTAELEKAVDTAERVCLQVASDVGIRVTPRASGDATWKPRRKVIRLAQRKRAAYTAALAAEQGGDAALAKECWDRFRNCKNELRAELRREKRDNWFEFVNRSLATETGGSRAMWQTVRRIQGKGNSAAVWQEVVNPRTEVLATSAEDIKEAWTEHTRMGATDAAPRPPEYWRRVAAEMQMGPRPLKPLEGLLGESLSWPTIMAAVWALHPGKAGGRDSIPADFYRLLLDCEMPLRAAHKDLHSAYAAEAQGGEAGGGGTRNASGRREGTGDESAPDVLPLGERGSARVAAKDAPVTYLGAMVWRILDAVWRLGVIPSAWEESVLVYIAKKGGDATSTSASRGISLMPSLLKVLATAVAISLEEAMERSEVFVREQAGFRRREECVGQAVAVMEACERRMGEGKATGLLFVDFKEAFPSVPHGALLAKLQRYGVDGPTLRFVEALYKQSAVVVRQADGSMSERIYLQRGVRQGCPLSPTLFKVFINDICRYVKTRCHQDVGVFVPGWPASDKLVGALFADDLVLFADRPEQLEWALEAVVEWADTNGMRLGVRKCGMMVVSREAEVREEWKRRLTPERRRVHREVVPIVSDYVYLGLFLDEKMSLEGVIEHRTKLMLAALNAAGPMLRNSSISLHARASVLRACVVPVGLYGAEVWGGSDFRARRMQKVVNMGLRWLLGAKATSLNMPMGTVMREIRLAPIAASAKARMVRLHLASRRKRTVIAEMVRRRPTGAYSRSVWSGRAGMQTAEISKDLERQEKEGDGAGEDGGEEGRRRLAAAVTTSAAAKKRDAATRKAERMAHLEEMPVHEVVEWVTETEWCRIERESDPNEDKGKSLKRYKAAGFEETSLASAKMMWPAGWGTELRQLERMRLGATITMESMKREGWGMGEELGGCCPFCGEGAQETYEHWVLRCKRWKAQRRKYIRSLIREAKEALLAAGEEVNDNNVWDLLMGGAVKGVRLTGWGWCKTMDMQARMSVGKSRRGAAEGETRSEEGEEEEWDEEGEEWECQPAYYRVASFILDTQKLRMRQVKELDRGDDDM